MDKTHYQLSTILSSKAASTYLLFVPISTIPNNYPKRSTYDDVNEWLSHWTSRDDARMVAMDLQSHRNIGQGL